MCSNYATESRQPYASRNRIQRVEVWVVDPREMFIGGDDLRWQVAYLDTFSGRLALSPVARSRGWPIFLISDRIEIRIDGRSYFVHWTGHGPEPWHAEVEEWGMYDIREIQKHGDSVFLDLTDPAFQRICAAEFPGVMLAA
ncbi:hypothetical protein [Modicisalibacter xianhensis]|uniref:hypothetical protein n=1 Tax=Modicisalibacter xianhensis TaxID=442341 RepID=UPI000B82E40D|nr:hypothetical protein [Halomonas xianhensis]